MKFILIVPVSIKHQAEAFSKQLDPQSIGEDFTTPLRTIGSPTVTHFASLPNVTDENIITAIRQLSTDPTFSSTGIYAECEAPEARSTFLSLLTANGLEEIPFEE